jgi:hypothetical protein
MTTPDTASRTLEDYLAEMSPGPERDRLERSVAMARTQPMRGLECWLRLASEVIDLGEQLRGEHPEGCACELCGPDRALRDALEDLPHGLWALGHAICAVVNAAPATETDLLKMFRVAEAHVAGTLTPSCTDGAG